MSDVHQQAYIVFSPYLVLHVYINNNCVCVAFCVHSGWSLEDIFLTISCSSQIRECHSQAQYSLYGRVDHRRYVHNAKNSTPLFSCIFINVLCYCDVISRALADGMEPSTPERNAIIARGVID